MKKVILALLVLFAVSMSGCVSEQQLSEQQIRQEIEKANYCSVFPPFSVDDDCTIVNFGCPFGCGSYVNRASVDYLKALVADYQKSNIVCEYMCGTPALPMCKQGKCVEKICEMNKEYDELSSKINGTYYYPCACPNNSEAKITEEREIGFYKFKCVPIPDFSDMNSGERVMVTVDLREEPESVEQLILPGCEFYNKENQKYPALTIFRDGRYGHSVQVCYKQKVDCKNIVRISGELQKFQGDCWKGSTQEDKKCDYYAINADDISCFEQ